MECAMKPLKILIACECSQQICKRFRALGDECYSCDICDNYGGFDEWHIKGDVRHVLYGDCAFMTQDGKAHYIDKWDLVIAHPPCTYLCRAQNGMYNEKRFGTEKVKKRIELRERAVEFFMIFTKLDCPCVIENPVGYMTKRFRKPDQYIEPYQFGHDASKKTGLWLFGMPKLRPTKVLSHVTMHKFENSNSMSEWYFQTSKAKDRAKVRSKTFDGIADAIANQYHDYLTGRGLCLSGVRRSHETA